MQIKEIIYGIFGVIRGRILKFLTKNEGYKQFGYFCSMKGLKAIFNFYINASIHIALAVVCLLQITGILFAIEISNYLLCFVFFSTISCYNFIKYGVEAEKYFLVVKAYHKKIQFVSLVSLTYALYCSFFLTKEAILGCFLLIILTGIYAIPVLPKARNFRDLGGLKILPVALVWSGITVIIPFLNIKQPLSWDIYMEALQRFILVLILLIPFEIRDLKYDPPGLNTLPQKYGVTKSKIFGAYAVIVFFLITYLKDSIATLDLVSKGILFLLLGVLMYTTKRNQSTYFASFWVEAIPIVWLGIVYGLNLFVGV
ncbi:hypothetical protein [uncultured Maribacter sp.]|uniref:hypothetical protein n=1 Tax=uncultured Maribacter sp. TaxID=431308 RepID=UPI00260A120D|nr:hypothetical protein [uncultured Maribacter sp.]